jgi:hypothetical protein
MFLLKSFRADAKETLSQAKIMQRLKVARRSVAKMGASSTATTTTNNKDADR